MSASNKEGRKACSLSYLPVRPQRLNSDWHIWLNDNKEFLTSLSNIMRYKIDAGLSESYTCYLLSKGKII
ncbi:Imm57 family immunity protein [Escherichia coli]